MSPPFSACYNRPWTTRQALLPKAKTSPTAGTGRAHSRHRLLVHLVWIPKYRRRVLEGVVTARLEALLRQAAEVNQWRIQELAIQPDHVHLMLQMHPRESIASVVKTLKGGTSHVLRGEYPELEEFLWGKSFWSDGYFAETIGRVNEAVVSDYIRRQQQSER
jgi:putative transposase